MHEGIFHSSIHFEDGFPCVLEAPPVIVFVIIVLVDIGHYHDARFGLSLPQQAVGALIHLPLSDPGGFVPSGSVQEIEHRITATRAVIIRREIHNHPSEGRSRHAPRVLHLFYQSFRSIVIADSWPRQIHLRVPVAQDTTGTHRQQDQQDRYLSIHIQEKIGCKQNRFSEIISKSR